MNKNKVFFKYLSLIIIVTVLAGCSFMFTKSSYMDEQEDKNSILIFAYIDDSETPFTIKVGDIKQVRPTSSEPYKELRSNNNGLVYLENLPTGLYKMISVGGPDKNILSDTTWTTHFPEPSEDPAFKRLELKAKKPGLYFLGSYKIDKVKDGGFFGTDRFETIAIKKPSEKEVLKQLVEYAKDTKWESIINRRIRQLK